MTDDEPKPVKEIVWTGDSDRRVRQRAEILKAGRDEKGRQVYTVAERGGKPADPAAAAAAKPAPRPAAKVPEKPAPQPAARAPAAAVPSPKDQSRAIAQTVVGSFVERMKVEATRKGGTLTLRDIEALDQEFEHKTAALQAVFEKSFEEYIRAGTRAPSAAPRENAFDRLIVGTFEHLLAGAKGPALKAGGLPRRMLPGFFMAMSMMLGPDVIDGYRKKCEAIVRRLTDPRGDTFTWAAVAADREAQDLLSEAQVAMALHFANPDKRAAWFIDLINNHLGPPADAGDEAEAAWQLSRPVYERFIDALFAGLMKAVAGPNERKVFSKRFGPDTCATVAAIMKGLGATIA